MENLKFPISLQKQIVWRLHFIMEYSKSHTEIIANWVCIGTVPAKGLEVIKIVTTSAEAGITVTY